MQSDCAHMLKPMNNWTNNCSGQLTGSTLCAAKASVLGDLAGLLSISPHSRDPVYRCLSSKVSTTEWSLSQALTGPVATGQNDTCADVIITTQPQTMTSTCILTPAFHQPLAAILFVASLCIQLQYTPATQPYHLKFLLPFWHCWNIWLLRPLQPIL